MRRSLSLLGVAAVALVASACGTVDIEVGSETDVGKIDVQTTLTPDDPPVTQTAPPTTNDALSLFDDDDDDSTDGEDALDGATDDDAREASESPESGDSSSSSSSTTTTTTTTTTTVAAVALEYHQSGYEIFATAGDLDVHMPVSRYETVGFHESGHDGAFQLEVVELADWSTLASRGRGTGSRTAADIVVPVGEPILAPIDGTVIRAGSYTLYCDHTDNFIVIEPTGRPGWELKIFHFDGLALAVGDEVVAASTLVGSSGRILPFESQVDEFTAEPSNPHVHIEVIDTSIPDRPSSGGGC